MRSLRLAVAFPALLVALLLVGAACGGSSDDDSAPAPSPTANSVGQEVAAEPTATATATQPPATTPTRTPTEVPSPTATPRPFDGAVLALRLPSLDVEAGIEDIGLLEGTNQLDVPHDPNNVGWYDIYDKPGFGKNAVFSAHVDYWPNIRGPFYELTEMEHGDEIVVVMEDGREYVYEVFFRERYNVNTIPMGDLIWPPDRPEDEEWITLITCGGEFQAYSADGSGPGQYLHRDVVVAKRIA